MSNFFGTIRRYTWLKSLIYVLFGLFALFEPNGTLNSFITVMAAFVGVFGVINLVAALKERHSSGQSNIGVTLAVLQLLAALMIWVLAKPLLAFLPIIMGVILGVNGISKIMSALNHKQYVNVSPLPFVLYGVLLVIVGVVLVFNPFSATLLAVRLFGVLLLIMAVMDIITVRKFKNQ
ncbi:hypothetical protein FC83_GL000539 [Agrilactobacillus composti DSM 18527 = JCM 14202]|uniref:Acid-resistance membrane protein n=1 Tax=Agrilactobacillus composti DSM 18527 = JCM 14202 TaxID=1423734 RepID=X0PUZ6_9LACO|nr:DUF308 domain-containing protein [Agrilactobacillus composti]KRM31859.1 hypothetical protein FC83_GL000539 [Agrilactobacillus composti DSM 18527 = JCM 14202]GAF41286.1 hypothetical protein JCM14202_3218 [Agrilactobacillus composti DSM 18527 = JCM 14202]